jgi:hypothetical protein
MTKQELARTLTRASIYNNLVTAVLLSVNVQSNAFQTRIKNG